jgi:hypothetical protein
MRSYSSRTGLPPGNACLPDSCPDIFGQTGLPRGTREVEAINASLGRGLMRTNRDQSGCFSNSTSMSLDASGTNVPVARAARSVKGLATSFCGSH